MKGDNKGVAGELDQQAEQSKHLAEGPNPIGLHVVADCNKFVRTLRTPTWQVQNCFRHQGRRFRTSSPYVQVWLSDACTCDPEFTASGWLRKCRRHSSVLTSHDQNAATAAQSQHTLLAADSCHDSVPKMCDCGFVDRH
eukprot:1150188-Pelagomonas_calceolata.AAC.1